MKMVAAAKLRRAQTAVQASRPYANSLHKIIETIASKNTDLAHPLFSPRENPKRISILSFTSNRGLCGGFNSNLLRQAETYIKSLGTRYELIDLNVIGKKGRDFYRARKRDPKNIFLEYADQFPFEEATKVAQGMIDGFLKGEYDEYVIIYNRFVSALTQEVKIEKLLPVSVAIKTEDLNGPQNLFGFIFEPSAGEVLDLLIPKYVATQIYRAHLESVASELGARMAAMDSATKNAKDMISSLTLQYNRARQAAITRELMDIVNGAESIK